MAKPRVFVSSTYYDLKHIRVDIERFIKEQGYDPVLNEKGHVPYGSIENLEEYCYKEIDLCDILISIIGGRFGSESKDPTKSISNLELKTAIDSGKQVYIFIENHVASEYRTYQANKEKDITFAAVDDKRIYQFIDDVFNLPLNNQVKNFESIHDITNYLREQWAGLFQRLLDEHSKKKETNIIEELKNATKTLGQMVNYLIDEKSKGDATIKDILLSNHPAFSEIRSKIGIPYRIIFQTKTELNEILKARKYRLIESQMIDAKDGYLSWVKDRSDHILRISEDIFDGENLKIFTPNEWNSSWIEEDVEIPF